MEPSSGQITAERLQRNLGQVRARMAEAAAKAARPAAAVKLVAVTKTVGLAEIRRLLDLGVRDFGEARVQDAERKIGTLQADSAGTASAGDRQPISKLPEIGVSPPPPPLPHWHLIGHLQTNKADKAAGLFQAVHTVDSLRVAQALNKERLKRSLPPLLCLLEVNVAGEAQKFGLPPALAEAGELLRQCAELAGLKLAGLMCMAPYTERPEATSRPVFRRLRELLAEANAKGCYPTPLTELSMGMSQDYAIAIEEGATMVRVGTALFE